MEHKPSLRRRATGAIIWGFAVLGFLVCVLGVIALAWRSIEARKDARSQPTRLPVPTMTPYPTIEATRAYEIIQDLTLSPTQCDLPCWWGFRPGETALEGFHQILSPLLDLNEARYSSDVNFSIAIQSVNSIGRPYSVTFRFDNQILDTIRVNDLENEPAQAYSLPTIMQSYGRPDGVCIVLQDYLPDEPRMVLALLYTSKGMEISYTYFPWVDCCIAYQDLVEINDVNLTLWDPDGNSPITLCQSENSQSAQPFKPIDEVTDMSVDAFYERYYHMEDGQSWIEISTQCWERATP